MSQLAAVTGAFSYIGSAVAHSLGQRGCGLRTLTNRGLPIHDPELPIEVHPLQFDDAAALTDALRGAQMLVNTYWVRYPYVGVDFDRAVANIGVLLQAAQAAGVQRIVQVSVSNPTLDSPLAYYRGKAAAEQLVRGCGLSYAIVRPTLVVGGHDILVNNIAWFLRRFPFFAMPGSGSYRLQPVTLDDVGEIVADAALANGDRTLDAAGPEVFTFDQLVRLVASAIGCRPAIVRLPPALSLLLLRAVGWLVGEVILSAEELAGLTGELLVSHEPARGRQSVREWIAAHGDELGRSYASELARHGRAVR